MNEKNAKANEKNAKVNEKGVKVPCAEGAKVKKIQLSMHNNVRIYISRKHSITSRRILR